MSSSSENPSSHDPKCSIPSLPVEIQIIIIKSTWNRNLKEYQELLNYSLVCSTWRSISQQILFTEVSLRTVGSVEHFLAAIQGNEALGLAVRNLEIVVQGSQAIRIFPLIQPITAQCLMLYRLRLHIINVFDPADLMNILAPHTYATLKALSLSLGRVHIPGSDQDIRTTDILHFLARFSDLSHLSLVKPFKPLSPYDIELPPTPSFRLYELFWTDSLLSIASYEQILGWILGEGRSSRLRILRIFGRKYSDTMALSMLHAHGRELHSLRLWDAEFILNHSEVPLSTLCPDLKELVIHWSRLTKRARMNLPTESLEHIEFGLDNTTEMNSDDSDNEASETAVSAGESTISLTKRRRWVYRTMKWILSLPKIRHVTCRGVGSDTGELIKNLLSKFSDRGITIDFISIDSRKHDDIKNDDPEDPVQTAIFPRRRSMTNLNKMIIRSP